jgi:hypothetical protein
MRDRFSVPDTPPRVNVSRLIYSAFIFGDLLWSSRGDAIEQPIKAGVETLVRRMACDVTRESPHLRKSILGQVRECRLASFGPSARVILLTRCLVRGETERVDDQNGVT